jgi:hypothetical protein
MFSQKTTLADLIMEKIQESAGQGMVPDDALNQSLPPKVIEVYTESVTIVHQHAKI